MTQFSRRLNWEEAGFGDGGMEGVKGLAPDTSCYLISAQRWKGSAVQGGSPAARLASNLWRSSPLSLAQITTSLSPI